MHRRPTLRVCTLKFARLCWFVNCGEATRFSALIDMISVIYFGAGDERERLLPWHWPTQSATATEAGHDDIVGGDDGGDSQRAISYSQKLRLLSYVAIVRGERIVKISVCRQSAAIPFIGSCLPSVHRSGLHGRTITSFVQVTVRQLSRHTSV